MNKEQMYRELCERLINVTVTEPQQPSWWKLLAAIDAYPATPAPAEPASKEDGLVVCAYASECQEFDCDHHKPHQRLNACSVPCTAIYGIRDALCKPVKE